VPPPLLHCASEKRRVCKRFSTRVTVARFRWRGAAIRWNQDATGFFLAFSSASSVELAPALPLTRPPRETAPKSPTQRAFAVTGGEEDDVPALDSVFPGRNRCDMQGT